MARRLLFRNLAEARARSLRDFVYATGLDRHECLILFRPAKLRSRVTHKLTTSTTSSHSRSLRRCSSNRNSGSNAKTAESAMQ